MGIREHLTAVDYGNGVTDPNQARKGMYYFAATGPQGAVCGHCGHKVESMVKGEKNEEGRQKETPSLTHMFCGMALTYWCENTRKCPEIEVVQAACKYFTPKKES